MKHTKIIYYLLFIITLTFLFTFSVNTSSSISTTVNLYMNKVFPSLFLFILFTNIVVNSKMLEILSNSFSFITKILKLSRSSSSVIILGFLAGFPSASSTIDKLYADSKISLKDAYHLMFFTNNASPIFIFSAVGVSMLGSPLIGLKLLLIHISSSIILGISYSIFYKDKYIIQENQIKLNTKVEKIHKNIEKFDILKKCILDSFKTMLFILAYMIIFNILGDVITSYNIPYIEYVTSTFELTKGISYFSQNVNIPYISFLLGFSSFSIIFQIKSSLKNLNYPLKNILLSKLLHGIVSYILALLIF